MSQFSVWYVAGDDDVDGVLEETFEGEATYLDAICELELLKLGEVLGARYDPAPLREGEAVVLRVNTPFLKAVASIENVPTLAASWRATAEHLADFDPEDVEDAIRNMQRCAQAGLAGPGVVSMPSL